MAGQIVAFPQANRDALDIREVPALSAPQLGSAEMAAEMYGTHPRAHHEGGLVVPAIFLQSGFDLRSAAFKIHPGLDDYAAVGVLRQRPPAMIGPEVQGHLPFVLAPSPVQNFIQPRN